MILPTPLFADPPGDALRAVRQQAHNVGEYTFTADAVQTLIPRATAAMVGERNRRVEMHLSGDVSLPAKANITLKMDGDDFSSAPVQLIQDGGKTTVIQNGETIPIETPVGVFGAGDVLTNVLRLTNFETFTVPNVSLVVSSTGNLQNKGVAGATCTACPPDSSAWALTINQMPPGASQLITFTQQVAQNPGTTTVATTSVSIRLNTHQLPVGNLQLPPQITALPPDGSLVGVGTQTILGSATDGNGGGIARIEYRLGDTDPWKILDGANRRAIRRADRDAASARPRYL